MGFFHSNYTPFTKKKDLVMPYISLTNKKNSKESLTTIFCTVIIHLYISFNRKLWMSRCHSHRHSQTVTSEKRCSCVQNCTEHLSHTYTTMPVTKTNVTISLTQPNAISLDCQVLGCHFGWHGNIMAPDHPKMILGVHRDRMHESKVSLDGFTIRNSRSLHPSLQ